MEKKYLKAFALSNKMKQINSSRAEMKFSWL